MEWLLHHIIGKLVLIRILVIDIQIVVITIRLMKRVTIRLQAYLNNRNLKYTKNSYELYILLIFFMHPI